MVLIVIIFIFGMGQITAMERNLPQELLIAASVDKIDQVRKLLAENVSTEARDAYGRTPLMRAVREGHKDIAQVLLAAGADKNVQDNLGMTLLNCALLSSSSQLVEMVGQGIQHDVSPLLQASADGIIERVGYLLDVRVDKELRNDRGCTPLLIACLHGHEALVKYLLRRGVNKDAIEEKGYTALMCASEKGALLLVTYLVEELGVEIDKTNDIGATAFLVAAANGRLEIMKYLLSKGANRDAVNNDGLTALMGESVEGHIDIVKYLVEELKVEVDKVTKEGSTAFLLVSGNGRLEIMKYLLRYLKDV